MSALRHGLRAPDESKLPTLDGANRAWLEDEPYRTSDWSKYPDQDRLLAVTQFSLAKYLSILYNDDGTPRTEGGAKADFDAKLHHLMQLVLKVVEGRTHNR